MGGPDKLALLHEGVSVLTNRVDGVQRHGKHVRETVDERLGPGLVPPGPGHGSYLHVL